MIRHGVFLIIVLINLCCAGLCLAGEQVVLYDCPRLAAPPVIDGKADDAAWQPVPAVALPYKFSEMTPTPAGSRSEFKAAFDDANLYLTCTFYRDSDAPLKTNHAGHDDPDLWKDDSTEIYFDTANDGHFYKFIVNSAGVFTDLRYTDAGIDYTWEPTHAKVAAAADDKGWSLEMAVPWRDFGLTFTPGMMCGFEVLRFSGANWSSWTVGASWAHPEKFGYLCFGGGGFLNELQRLLQTLRKTKGDQWQLVTPAGILQYQAAAPALETVLAQTNRQLTEARFDVRVLADEKKREELLAKLTALQAVIDEARQLATTAPDTARVQAMLGKLTDAAAIARDVSYDARIAQVLEKK